MVKRSAKQTKTRTARRAAAVAIMLSALAAVSFSAARVKSNPAPDKYTLKFITYNVCGLPDFLIFDRNLVPTAKRYEYIADKLKKYDVIGLQENFQFRRTIIEKKLGEYFVGHGTDISGVKNVGSGVYTFSRYSITKILYERWNPSSGADMLSHKGYVGITTEVGPGFSLDVYNLHAQAGGEHSDEYRTINYNMLNDGIKAISGASGHPYVMLGDYNCHFGEPECNHLLKITGAKSVVPESEQEGVDHIFYNENGSEWKITVLDARKAFAYDADGMIDGKYVSDHEAFEATLQFERKK